jgi:outer membrane protein assembly factor BamB
MATSALLMPFLAFGAVFLLVGFITSFINKQTSVLPLSVIFPLQIEGSLSLMLPSDGNSPNIVAETYDVSSQSFAVTRLDLASHKALWNSLGQKEFLHIDAMLAGDTHLYLVIKNRLIALQLSDGQQAWETSLSDELAGACRRCITLQAGRLLVLTMDKTLGAYDAATGHQAWEKHFDNAGHTLYPLGQTVALAYSLQRGAALGVFDVATGSEKLHLEPTCKPPDGLQDEMDVSSYILLDTAGPTTKAYIFFGLFNSCVQRWDLSSGKMDWQTMDEQHRLSASDDTPALLAHGRLYLSSDRQLSSMDAATGQQVQVVDDTRDYFLIPILVDGQHLVVRARRTRGSTRYELWAYDLNSGKNAWKHPILNGSPIDPPGQMSGLISENDQGWTLLQASDGLWLITFQTAPNQVNLARINLDTGEWTGQKSLSLGLDSSTEFYDIPQRIESQDHLGWYALVNRIYAIDPAAGTTPYRWP